MARRKGLDAPVPHSGSPIAKGRGRKAGTTVDVPSHREVVLIEGAGQRMRLIGPRVLIGRAGGGLGASLELDDESVSRNHAELVTSAHGWELRDLGSTNGSKVDGVAVAPGEPVRVRAGSVLLVGRVELKLVLDVV